MSIDDDAGTTILAGPVGVATRCTPGRFAGEARFAAWLAGWLIEARGVHPFWHHWHLSACHLRDVPGLPRAVIHAPGVTHELICYALDSARDPRPDDPQTWCRLDPYNFAFQFVASSDERARSFCDAVAGALVAGQLFLEPMGIQGARDLHAQILMLALEELDPTPADAPARPCHLEQP